MTKDALLRALKQAYACGNRADHEARHEHGEAWTKPEMAGSALCAPLDQAIHAMRDCGAITEDDLAAFYDF